MASVNIVEAKRLYPYQKETKMWFILPENRR
jgi:hypothetical protein